jgi:peptide/nickel transport system substrate-binding protein
VILKPIDSATIRVTALRAGDVDITERTAYEWVKEIVEGKLKGIGYVQAPYAGFRKITFNVTDPPFNNKKLRFAIAHAVDKKEILNGAYFGFGEPAEQKYPKGHAWYFEGLPSPGYNPEKARALLKEAGYKGEVFPVLTHKGEERETEAAILPTTSGREKAITRCSSGGETTRSTR